MASQWHRSGIAVAPQWRRSGAAVAPQWHGSGSPAERQCLGSGTSVSPQWHRSGHRALHNGILENQRPQIEHFDRTAVVQPGSVDCKVSFDSLQGHSNLATFSLRDESVGLVLSARVPCWLIESAARVLRRPNFTTTTMTRRYDDDDDTTMTTTRRP